MSSAGTETIAYSSTKTDPFQRQTVHRIRSDQEAIKTAQQIAAQFEAAASDRDQNRRLPYTELNFLRRAVFGVSRSQKRLAGQGYPIQP